MPYLVTLLSAVFCSMPPERASAPDPGVLAKEYAGLNKTVREWFAARVELERADDRKRAAASKKEQKAKEAVLKEWEAKAKKQDPLKHVPDLRAIFANCFEYKRPSGVTGDIRTVKEGERGDETTYQVMVPKNYKPESAVPTVIVLGDYAAEKSSWSEARAHFGAAWKASAAVDDILLVYPTLVGEFDAAPDLSKAADFEAEQQRLKTVLSTAGLAQRELNVDRDALFLDCGKGASAFGLRLATYFPNRFAGLILRHPTSPGDIRLDGLVGLPVLLVSSAETKAECDKIAAGLNQLQQGSCTVIEGKGEHPFGESAPDIIAWCGKQRREFFRPRVIVANNHDLFRNAYWLNMGTADPLAECARNDRPYLEAVADRGNNRITVTARRVTNFVMLLNDDLVDMDKELTVIVNGKAQTHKLTRNRSQLIDGVFEKFDPGFLFTSRLILEVPEQKPEEAAGKGGGAK
jgi:hypothetical protein